MLENPLIFGIVSSTIITTIFTLIMLQTHKDTYNGKPYNKNNSIILFTISLIVISLAHLFVSSNIIDLNPGSGSDLASNVSCNMLTGTPGF